MTDGHTYSYDTESGSPSHAVSSDGLRAAWNSSEDYQERAEALRQLVSQNQRRWQAAICNLIPEYTTDEEMECFVQCLCYLLANTDNREGFEKELATAAHGSRSIAYVVGAAFYQSFDDGTMEPLHAFKVLGEDFVFDTWRRFKASWRSEDGQYQQFDVTVDFWVFELILGFHAYDPQSLLTIYLRYLEVEPDPMRRGDATYDWLDGLASDRSIEVQDEIMDRIVQPNFAGVLRSS